LAALIFVGHSSAGCHSGPSNRTVRSIACSAHPARNHFWDPRPIPTDQWQNITREMGSFSFKSEMYSSGSEDGQYTRCSHVEGLPDVAENQLRSKRIASARGVRTSRGALERLFKDSRRSNACWWLSSSGSNLKCRRWENRPLTGV
jgi:hypothetical protein